MIWIGMGIAVLVILLDLYLKAKGSSFRTPVLAVAVGIYLPFDLSVPIFLGGFLAWIAQKVREQGQKQSIPHPGEHHGLLFSAGLITGEAVIGILLAIPIAIQGPKALAFWGTHEGSLPGILLMALVGFLLYRYAATRSSTNSTP